jgi:hypothetical protein
MGLRNWWEIVGELVGFYWEMVGKWSGIWWKMVEKVDENG